MVMMHTQTIGEFKIHRCHRAHYRLNSFSLSIKLIRTERIFDLTTYKKPQQFLQYCADAIGP